MKYYADNHITIYNQDCRSMAELPDNSVQCVVTSPPYWRLRKYSGEQELVWGDGQCEHEWVDSSVKMQTGGVSDKQQSNRGITGEGWQSDSGFCSLCGAWKGSYGLEPTPELYIQHTIEILREIRRVLRKDGVVFWNIGDSYTAGGMGGHSRGDKFHGHNHREGDRLPKKPPPGLKPKDLCLIPFKVAIAAQEDGWWVRSVIIWSKNNPMPESVTDRPTESHEYIIMLTKSARYYWDADAVRETQTGNAHSRGTEACNAEYQEKRGSYKGFNSPAVEVAGGRNIRSVWEFPTQPYPEAHFAVFPEKLPELCIKAATPEAGCCAKCGSPWERIVEKTTRFEGGSGKAGRSSDDINSTGKWAGQQYGENIKLGPVVDTKTIGWQPTCKCNTDKVPSLVLDPFSGAGTTLWVSKKLNRHAVGYELSEEYCQLAVKRNRQQGLL